MTCKMHKEEMRREREQAKYNIRLHFEMSSVSKVKESCAAASSVVVQVSV